MIYHADYFLKGMEGYSPDLDSGIDKIQCRIRENVDGMNDLTATREAGLAKIWARDSEVAMTEGAEMRDQDPLQTSF